MDGLLESRALRFQQRELGYAPASARHTASAHPTAGGLHLPRVPYRREKLSSLPPRHQRRKLVAMPIETDPWLWLFVTILCWHSTLYYDCPCLRAMYSLHWCVAR
eukprot:6204101-Pleurochrysis_carterae.AAC.3